MSATTAPKMTDREFRAAHPRKEWEAGFTESYVNSYRAARGGRPTLYTAYRNRETGQVDYLHGRQVRTASPQLAARFTGMRYR